MLKLQVKPPVWITGPPGAPGTAGAPGSAGATGNTGSTGPQGALGSKGDQGNSGPKGDTGQQGAAGPNGDDYTGSVVYINKHLFGITQVRSGSANAFATLVSSDNFGGIATAPYTLSGGIFTMIRATKVTLTIPWTLTKTTISGGGAATINILLVVNGDAGENVGTGSILSTSAVNTILTGSVTLVPRTFGPLETKRTFTLTINSTNGTSSATGLTLEWNRA